MNKLGKEGEKGGRREKIKVVVVGDDGYICIAVPPIRIPSVFLGPKRADPSWPDAKKAGSESPAK